MQQPWIVIRPHRLPLSFRLDRRVPLILLAATVVTLAVMVINIGVGEYPIPALDVIKTVLHLPPTIFDNANFDDYNFIVNTLRLPRMLVAALVGVALGISGAIMQGLTRNPLATPDILGISAGAGLVAVTLIVVVQDVPGGVIPLAAFGGALLIAEKLLLDDKSGPRWAQMQNLNMLTCTEGKERTLEEYEQLLKQAGFKTVVGCRTAAPLDAVLATKG